MNSISSEDFAEMSQVASLCMYLVDSKQWDRLDEVFTQDGVYDGRKTITGAVAEGVEAIVDLWSKLRMGVHYSTDLVVFDVAEDGTSARSISKWMSAQFDGRLNTGDYADEWLKTADGWRLTSRVNTIRKPDPGSK